MTFQNLVTIPLSKKEVGREVISQNRNFLQAYSVDTLVNNQQMSYYGTIQVGSLDQTFNVIFDTGSNQLWLPSKDCIQSSYNCQGLNGYYDCSASNGCSLTGKDFTLLYGKGQVTGYIATTSVGVCGLQKVQQSFLLVSQAKDFENIKADGLLGLGMYDSINGNNNSSFVTNMKQSGIIAQEMFSFYLGFGKSDSQLNFGGFDPKKVVDTSQIYFHKVVLNDEKNDSQRWSIQVKVVSFQTFSYSLNINQNIAIVDSGTSLILLSSNMYALFVKYLILNYDVQKAKDGFYYTSCSTSLPNINFILPDINGIDRQYSISSSFYFLQSGSYCLIGISSLPSGVSDVQIILGDIFMRRYVSLFSYSNSTVGLTQSIADPDDNYTNPLLQGWQIALIVVGGLLIVGIVCYCLYRKAKERRERNRNYLNQQLLSNQTQQQNYFQGQGVLIGGNYQNQNNQQYYNNFQGQRMPIRGINYNQNNNQNVINGQPVQG
ncbi:hypothetical protein ABPG72_006199 [Tetrahymena utriculariae]